MEFQEIPMEFLLGFLDSTKTKIINNYLVKSNEMLLHFFNFLAVVPVMPFCIKLKNNLASSVHNHHKSPCTFFIQLCSKKPNAD